MDGPSAFDSTGSIRMTHFPIHTLESAPAGARPALQAIQDVFGFVPRLAGAMANSPPVLDAFVGVFRSVHSGSFSEAQIQTLLLTNAVTNGSPWPVAFHSGLAAKQGVSTADVAALRAGRDPQDPALAPLSALARHLIERRGRAEPGAVQKYLDAGFSPAQALEVVLVVAASTITNYIAGLAQPSFEPEIEAQAWKPGAVESAP
jgi:alkylhydroperoxidase family enzyme